VTPRSNAVLDQVLTDLAAEGDQLESLVAPLDEPGWRKATPAEGWDIATTVVHLAWTDECAIAAGTDKEAWDALVLGRSVTRTASSTRRRSPGRRRARRRSWRAGGPDAPRCRRCCARCPRDRSCPGSDRR
jgi:hypothetical protein